MIGVGAIASARKKAAAPAGPAWNERSFDFPSGGYIDLGDVLDMSTSVAWAVNFWMKRSAAPPSGTVHMLGNRNADEGYNVMLHNSGEIRLVVERTGGDLEYVTEATASFASNTWMNVTVGVDGTGVDVSDMYIHVNGVDRAINYIIDGTGTGEPANSLSLYLGDSPQGLPFVGKLFDISFWSRNMSAANSASIYSSGTPTDVTALSFASDLECLIRAHNATTGAGGVPDASGNGITGTFSGGMDTSDISTDVPA